MFDLHDRRAFLRAALAAGAAWATTDLGAAEAGLVWSRTQDRASAATPSALTKLQWDALEAMAARILPAVDGRPGAREAGASTSSIARWRPSTPQQKTLYTDGVADLNRRAAAEGSRRDTLRRADRRAAGRAAARDREDAVLPGRRGSTRSSARSRCRRGAATATTPAGTCSASSTSRVPAAVRLSTTPTSTGEADMAQTPRPAARFRPSDVVDFVIVGSGAAGGIMAKELSTAGFSVVVLEQGPRLTEAEFDPRRVRARSCGTGTPTIRRRSRRRSAPTPAGQGAARRSR